MKQVLFTLLCALLIFSCEKEEGLQPEKPFGHPYSGLWTSDLVTVNGINASKNIQASLSLELDSTITRTGEVSSYEFTGIYEENERSQYNFLLSRRVEGLVAFDKTESIRPWEAPTLTLKIYKYESRPCGYEESNCFNEVTLALFSIKSSTEKVMLVETERNNVKYVYRFIRK
ncbi:MAG: hypothetical protein SFV55_01440 [Haliscomenobacter sp.]|uniref:hypothetical protein n=1 Tax=Haliscomenobacter sp. TaxID=2717303 RepID=UPI0029AFC3F5|nr:hypothetical protein [Haliscomenobacter sp.]MDX2067053.1 hypothetical protein [Haliscomenobacter sp.]